MDVKQHVYLLTETWGWAERGTRGSTFAVVFLEGSTISTRSGRGHQKLCTFLADSGSV